MDQPGPDDTVSLRAYAAELRPEEARFAFSAANAGRNGADPGPSLLGVEHQSRH